MPVLLLVTFTTIHPAGSFGGYMAFINNAAMTVQTRYLFGVDRHRILVRRDLAGAFPGPFLVASDTILGRVSPGIMNRKKNEESQRIAEESFHGTMWTLLSIEY